MENYKNEQQLTKRLRDYLESILSKIMLHSPEILEVNTNQPTVNSQKTQSKKLDSNTTSNKQRENSRTGAEIFTFSKNSDRVKFQL